MGETIPLRVEIQNAGDATVFVGSQFPRITGWIYSLELAVLDEEGNVSPTPRSFPPFVQPPSRKATFAAALSKAWIALPPGHFYGTTLKLGPDKFEFLRKLGRYRVKAVYTCNGMDAAVYYNQLIESPEELEQLPFKSWKGEIESNEIWLDIVAPGK